MVDWLSIGLALAAGIALFAFRVGVIPVIAAAGIAGILSRLLLT